MAAPIARRKFIAALGGAALQWPLSARAEGLSGNVFRIGFVGMIAANAFPERMEAFRAGLRKLGYQEGRNILIEYRWADEHYDRLPALFADLVRLNVDVIVTHATPGILAAKRATTIIPIVMAASSDAVASGLRSKLGTARRQRNRIDLFQPRTRGEAT